MVNRAAKKEGAGGGGGGGGAFQPGSLNKSAKITICDNCGKKADQLSECEVCHFTSCTKCASENPAYDACSGCKKLCCVAQEDHSFNDDDPDAVGSICAVVCSGTACSYTVCRDCHDSCVVCESALCRLCSRGCSVPGCLFLVCPKDQAILVPCDYCNSKYCPLCVANKTPCKGCGELPSRFAKKRAKKILQVILGVLQPEESGSGGDLFEPFGVTVEVKNGNKDKLRNSKSTATSSTENGHSDDYGDAKSGSVRFADTSYGGVGVGVTESTRISGTKEIDGKASNKKAAAAAAAASDTSAKKRKSDKVDRSTRDGGKSVEAAGASPSVGFSIGAETAMRNAQTEKAAEESADLEQRLNALEASGIDNNDKDEEGASTMSKKKKKKKEREKVKKEREKKAKEEREAARAQAAAARAAQEKAQGAERALRAELEREARFDPRRWFCSHAGFTVDQSKAAAPAPVPAPAGIRARAAAPAPMPSGPPVFSFGAPTRAAPIITHMELIAYIKRVVRLEITTSQEEIKIYFCSSGGPVEPDVIDLFLDSCGHDYAMAVEQCAEMMSINVAKLKEGMAPPHPPAVGVAASSASSLSSPPRHQPAVSGGLSIGDSGMGTFGYSSSSPFNRGSASGDNIHDEDTQEQEQYEDYEDTVLPEDEEEDDYQLYARIQDWKMRLTEAINSRDTVDIEAIMNETKGKPGMAKLRGKAKKNLKRLKTMEEEAQRRRWVDKVVASAANSHQAANKAQAAYLSTVRPAHIKDKPNKVLPVDRDDIGRVIGRNGSRIREISALTGTEVWLDQTVTPAVVYIHGDSAACERAETKIHEYIDSAPRAAAAAAAPTIATGRGDAWENMPAAASAAGGADSKLPPAGPQLSKKKSSLVLRPFRLKGIQARVCADGHVMCFVDCSENLIGYVIGKGGATIKKFMKTSGAHVEMKPNGIDTKIYIKGPPPNAERAMKMVIGHLHSMMAKEAPGQPWDEAFGSRIDDFSADEVFEATTGYGGGGGYFSQQLDEEFGRTAGAGRAGAFSPPPPVSISAGAHVDMLNRLHGKCSFMRANFGGIGDSLADAAEMVGKLHQSSSANATGVAGGGGAGQATDHIRAASASEASAGPQSKMLKGPDSEDWPHMVAMLQQSDCSGAIKTFLEEGTIGIIDWATACLLEEKDFVELDLGVGNRKRIYSALREKAKELKGDEEKQEEKQQLVECCVCMERPREVRLDPCRHFQICLVCVKMLETRKQKQCPYCRATFVTYQQCYC